MINVLNNYVSKNQGFIPPITAEPEGEIIIESPIIVSQEHETPFETDRTYGIELEFLRPNNLSQPAIEKQLAICGLNIKQEQLNHITKPHWKLVSDHSVQSTIKDFDGCNELVSPVLMGRAGLNEIKLVCNVLIKLGCKVNQRCGLHVHHSLKHRNIKDAVRIAKNTVFIYHKYKDIFGKMMPHSRRRNHYCQWWTKEELDNLLMATDKIHTDNRYRVINWKAFAKHKTLEFRQHPGTLDPRKIINWIKITQAIVRRAVEKENPMEFNGGLVKEIGLKRDLRNYIKSRMDYIKEVKQAERKLLKIKVI